MQTLISMLAKKYTMTKASASIAIILVERFKSQHGPAAAPSPTGTRAHILLSQGI